MAELAFIGKLPPEACDGLTAAAKEMAGGAELTVRLVVAAVIIRQTTEDHVTTEHKRRAQILHIELVPDSDTPAARAWLAAAQQHRTGQQALPFEPGLPADPLLVQGE